MGLCDCGFLPPRVEMMDAQEMFRRNQALMAEYERQRALSSPPLHPAPVVSLDDFRPPKSSRRPENLSQSKPWQREGLSRATWYRRQLEQHGKTRWGGRRRVV